MAAYRLLIKPSAVKELEGIPRRDRQRIVNRIQGLSVTPRPAGCEKLSGQDRYRVRQGPMNVSGKTHTEYLWFNTKRHREYLNITPEVEEIVSRSGVREGMVLVSAMHITAGVYVNDAEEGLIQDIDELLQRLAPEGPDYHHHQTGETNGDAHLKNLLVHHQVIVPITNGKLDVGPWQQIYYAEFDGQRRKRVIVKVMGQ